MKLDKLIAYRLLIRIIALFTAIFISLVFLMDKKPVYLLMCLFLIVAVFEMISHHYFKQFVRKQLKLLGIPDDTKQSLQQMMNQLRSVVNDVHVSSARYKRMNCALNLVIEINNLFLKSNNQQSIYDFILSRAIKAIGKTSKGSILILDDDGNMHCISLCGFSESFKSLVVKKENDFLYRLTNGHCDHSVIIKDVVKFNKEVMDKETFEKFYETYPKRFQTVLSTPIRVDDHFIGVINIDGHEKNLFNDEDIFIMDLFASQLEVAIRNRKLLDEILYLSRYDDLTGVYNRKFFDDNVQCMIQNEKPFTYIIIDINDLKEVNDVYGHSEGDRLLKIFTDIVQKNIRESDVLSRLGGDEFALVLSHTSKMAASKIFKRVMCQLNTYKEQNNIPYDIDFSFGISSFPDEATNMEELYLLSDKKMYSMKREIKSKSSTS